MVALLYFATLCVIAAIGAILADQDGIAWISLGLTIFAGIAAHLLARYSAKLRLSQDIGLLRAALWDTVHNMENYDTRSSSRRGAGRAEMVERFARLGQEVGRQLPFSPTEGKNTTSFGFDVIDRNEADGSGHWRRVNGIRRGARVLFYLFTLGDPAMAYSQLLDHMRTQRMVPESAVPNLTQLKVLFGLPTTWPSHSINLEALELKGLSAIRSEEIAAAARHHGEIFRGVTYQPWGDPGQETPVYRGMELLDQMRSYVR